MDWFLFFKLTHIISSTILFGTGLGTAFYMWRADCSNDIAVIAGVSRNVVLADWVFTAPAVIVQPLTGIGMIMHSGWSFDASWIQASIGLYILVGICWLPVIWIQHKVAELAQQNLQLGSQASDDDFNNAYTRLMRFWYSLGWPAFTAVLVIFFLMVFKPILW